MSSSKLFNVTLTFLLALGGLVGMMLLLAAWGSGAPAALAQGGGTVRYVAPGGNCGAASPCYASVQAAVDAASSGDEIRVATGVYTGVQGRPAPTGYPDMPASGLITQVVYISKTLTVRGGYTTTNWTTPDPQANPTTLDAQGQGRGIFVGDGVTVTLEGLRITGGNATGLGGGASIGTNDAGGGVHVYQSTATISATAIYSNVAQDGGSNSTGQGGGLYANNSDVTLRASQIFSNTASRTAAGYGGGATFYGYGAGSYNGTATLVDNTIRDNVGSTGAKVYNSGYGGGLHFSSMKNISLQNNVIRDNTAMTGNEAGYGGGLYIQGAPTGVMISNTIQENTASRSTAGTSKGGNGGGIWVQNSPLTLTHNTVLSNTGCMGCSGGGGGIWADANLSMRDNTIRGNVASLTSRGKGGGMSVTHGADIQSNTIEGNTASRDNQGYGGGVYFSQWSATFGDNTVADNVASRNGEGWGGGLYVDTTTGAAAALAGNHVLSNTASLSSAGQGGGIFMTRSGISLMTNTIAFNVAGGVYFEAGIGETVLSGNLIYSNTATLSGGAAGQGGGLYGHRSKVTLVNNLFADNDANTAGSGLYFEGISSAHLSAKLLHNTIADNHSSGQGVYGGDYATLVFTNTIIANHPTVGITTTAGAVVTMTATLWQGNGSDVGGPGSIYTATNLYGDPAFADPPAWDYHLTAGSAAIDAGVDAGVTSDFEGDPRPAGAAPDLGHDEYRTVGVQLTPDRSGLGSPVRATVYTHTLTNTGNYTDTFALSQHAPAGWTVQVAPNPATVGQGAAQTIWVTITMPLDVISGTVGSVVITATSQTDTSVFATVTDTTTARVWRLYVPLVPRDYGP
jgi:hypothetical protein